MSRRTGAEAEVLLFIEQENRRRSRGSSFPRSGGQAQKQRFFFSSSRRTGAEAEVLLFPEQENRRRSRGSSFPLPLEGGGWVGVNIMSNFTCVARILRGQPTNAEKFLWQKLRDRQLDGYKFRRQQRIGHYIVDFANLEKKIVIELDGGQHAVEKEIDIKRDDWLAEEGFKVLRFWNNEVFENIEGVLETIRKELLSS